MSVVICPGIHDPGLTEDFLNGLETQIPLGLNFRQSGNLLIFPAQDYLALSPFHILQFLQARLGSPSQALPIVFISFSAGVVGALGAAWGWQLLGGKVKALIALDGWGVALFGNFPIYRLSHDYFTHWSSSLLESGQDSFYADPAVEHLELWRASPKVSGWWEHSAIEKSQPRSYTTAALFMTMLLKRYGEC